MSPLDRLAGAGRDVRLWASLCLALLPAYALVFILDGLPLGSGLVSASLISVGGLWLVGLVMRPMIRRALDLPALPRRVIVVLLAFAFAFLWYVTVASLLGWANSGFRAGGRIPDFSGPAFRWQMLQGVMAYAALAAFVDGARLAQHVAALPVSSDGAANRHLLIRDGDEIVRISLEEIVSLQAREEQVLVATGTRTYPVRRSLNDLEQQLPDNFLRIHRSAIVNLDKIERLEPAGGGRMTIHLSDGSAPVASRSGTKRLRSQAV